MSESGRTLLHAVNGMKMISAIMEVSPNTKTRHSRRSSYISLLDIHPKGSVNIPCRYLHSHAYHCYWQELREPAYSPSANKQLKKRWYVCNEIHSSVRKRKLSHLQEREWNKMPGNTAIGSSKPVQPSPPSPVRPLARGRQTTAFVSSLIVGVLQTLKPGSPGTMQICWAIKQTSYRDSTRVWL